MKVNQRFKNLLPIITHFFSILKVLNPIEEFDIALEVISLILLLLPVLKRVLTPLLKRD